MKKFSNKKLNEILGRSILSHLFCKYAAETMNPSKMTSEDMREIYSGISSIYNNISNDWRIIINLILEPKTKKQHKVVDQYIAEFDEIYRKTKNPDKNDPI